MYQLSIAARRSLTRIEMKYRKWTEVCFRCAKRYWRRGEVLSGRGHQTTSEGTTWEPRAVLASHIQACPGQRT